MKIKEKRWKQIDEQFVEIQGNIDLDNYLSPVNRTEELQRFKESVANGRTYNPIFEYDPLPDVRENDLKRLRSELNPVDPVEKVYFDAITIRLGEIAAAQQHDGQTVSKQSISAYGQPNDALLEIAWKNLKKSETRSKGISG